MAKPLVEIKGLKKYFEVGGGLFTKPKIVRAVDGVDMVINEGETMGLVGESGCGKTTLGRCLLNLITPTAGDVIFDGEPLFKEHDGKVKLVPGKKEMQKIRRKMQIVFQDPQASLNQRMIVKKVLREPFIIHGLKRKVKMKERVKELLELVGLSEPHKERYPHEFSGGQRQRIGIARALALNPKFIVCDEPISALDVSVSAQILNLLIDLRKKLDLTYLFIAHDLSVVKHISDHVSVMYVGKIVERGTIEEVFDSAAHPYTVALLSAVPIPDPTIKRKRIILKGDIPSPISPPPGCRFHTRCPIKREICEKEEPELKLISGTHYVACHFPVEGSLPI